MMSAGLMARNQKYPKRFPLFLLQFLDGLRAMIAKQQSAVLAFAIFLLQYQYRNGPSLFQVLPGGMYFWKRQVSDRR